MADDNHSPLIPLFRPNERNNPTKKTEKRKLETPKTETKRKFKTEWMSTYTWLRYEDEKITCAYCVANTSIAGKSDFATGKSGTFKVESLAKHNASQKHKYCRDICLNQQLKTKPLVQSVRRFEEINSEKIKNDLMMKMNTVFTVATEELPFTKFKGLLALQKKNGLDVSYTYANDVKSAEMIATIANEMKSDVANTVNNSRYISVMLDSATDCSIKETEAVVVRCLGSDGKPVNKLLGLVELQHAHADGIIDAISSQFVDIGKDDFKEDLVSFCADGASVNHGKRGGVRGKLNETCPWIIGIWCLPHRLELAMMSMLKTCDMAAKVIKVLDLLYRTYHWSCKSKREFKAIAETLDISARNPSRATGT